MRRTFPATLAALLLAPTLASQVRADPALSSTPPPNGDEVQIIVKGVAVPYSVFGLIKRLEQIPGVITVDFKMRSGLADIKLKPGAHLSDEQLRAVIKNASYTPGDIHWISQGNDGAKSSENDSLPR